MIYSATPPSTSSPPYLSHSLAPELALTGVVPCCSLCTKIVHNVKSSFRLKEESSVIFASVLNKKVHNSYSKRIQLANGDCTMFCSFFSPFRKVNRLPIRHPQSLACHGFPRCSGCATGYYQIFLSWHKKLKSRVPFLLIHLAMGMVLVMSLSLAVSPTPSWALSEENLLFLEAWRTIDRAYYDKSFNGQSWFRYRETALRNEPMNTRQETYEAIKKMLESLDDPFTRFLEPEKFRSLRSGTQGSLTGVGLSIGYPIGVDAPSGLVVISSSAGGPAFKAGIVPGDVILSIDGAATETMDLYDAAERLQGPEGTYVELSILGGQDLKQIILKREKVSLNPVKSRLCEVQGSGKEISRVGYIKLASFNQNASGAVKEAIETLQKNNVKAFVLDLRNNSGGLFPEGIEIAKIWLEKGVIVYICDSRGVRDIYEADGSNAISSTEPLAVLSM